MLTKKSEKQFCLQRFLNLGWRGGQKYSQNRSKSSNKWKCHEGWSLKTLRVVVVLRTNNVGEYFEGPKRCQIAMDCKILVGKANRSKVEGENHLHPVTEVISKRSD